MPKIQRTHEIAEVKWLVGDDALATAAWKIAALVAPEDEDQQREWFPKLLLKLWAAFEEKGERRVRRVTVPDL